MRRGMVAFAGDEEPLAAVSRSFDAFDQGDAVML
jgi:hypothetical protein